MCVDILWDSCQLAQTWTVPSSVPGTQQVLNHRAPLFSITLLPQWKAVVRGHGEGQGPITAPTLSLSPENILSPTRAGQETWLFQQKLLSREERLLGHEQRVLGLGQALRR